MSRDDQASEEGPEAHEPEAHEPEAIPPFERRLRAMEAARPDDAPTLRELAEACSWEAERDGAGRFATATGAVEAAQLAAFEAGEPDWWLATPLRGGGSGGGHGDDESVCDELVCDESVCDESVFRDSGNRRNLTHP